MDPVIVVGGARVFHGDCIEVLKQLPENSVDSIVTDPPYGLEFMGKDWDAPWKAGSNNFAGNVEPTADSAGGVSAYASARVRYSRGPEAMVGFQLWATEWAVECLRVLKPGGHLLAFGGSRTWHRLAVAIEDAGFEIRDNIAWIYGSGFPKSLDVSKAIEAKIVTGSSSPKGQRIAAMGDDYTETPLAGSPDYGVTGNFSNKDTGNPGMKITTSEAKTWEGWGTALKPAHEPVVVGRKPLIGTVAENVLAWGVGGLNIDGSRIGSENVKINTFDNGAKPFGDAVGEPYTSRQSQGRWPANVILDEVTAGLLDEQSGERPGGQFPARRGNSVNTSFASGQETPGGARGMGDTGGASRFFYVAKASKRDRNEGLEELEAVRHADRVVDDGPCGENPRNRTNTAKQNFHPTVKPTQLMRYLIKLVTPPGGTVLDPFTGSGSTGKAALLDGFDFVGVELTEEYLPIIEGRLRWANEQVDDDDTLF